jgi:hypothetical protein
LTNYWSIIRSYNNYANSPNAKLIYPINLFVYNDEQLDQINSAVANFFENSNIKIPNHIIQLINNIRLGNNNMQVPQHVFAPAPSPAPSPAPFIAYHPDDVHDNYDDPDADVAPVSSNTNSITNFTPNTIYIYINNEGRIGRTLPYFDTQNGVPRFGTNGNIILMPLDYPYNQNLFFTNIPNEQLPVRLRPDQLVPGVRYIGGNYSNRGNNNILRLERLEPFIELYNEHGFNGALFGDNETYYNLNSNFFYSESELNRVGIFLNN